MVFFLSFFFLSFFLSSSLARCKEKRHSPKTYIRPRVHSRPAAITSFIFVLFLSRLIIISTIHLSTIHLSVATISIPVSCDYSAAATILTSASLRLRNWIALLNVPISLSRYLVISLIIFESLPDFGFSNPSARKSLRETYLPFCWLLAIQPLYSCSPCPLGIIGCAVTSVRALQISDR